MDAVAAVGGFGGGSGCLQASVVCPRTGGTRDRSVVGILS